MGGTLVISQNLPERFGDEPIALYVGGIELGEPSLSWWWPNQACLEQILLKLGFREVELVGHNRGVMRPTGVYYDPTARA